MERYTEPGKFSELQIRKAKPKASSYKMYDGGGLYLLVSKAGSKIWKFKYRFDGRERCATIGRYRENYGGVSLAEARHIAINAKDLVSRNIDPKVHIDNRAFCAGPAEFMEVAKMWHEEQSLNWLDSYAEEVWKSLERDVFPVFGKCNITEITSLLCRNLLVSIQDRGAIETCKKIKRRLFGIFKHAKNLLLVEENPMDSLDDFGQKRPSKGYSAIKCEELPSFLSDLESSACMEEVTKLGLEMIAHTIVRNSELRYATWDEFDLENKRWNIPGHRMKRGLSHVVPITPHVEKILAKLKLINGHRKYVFASSTKPAQPISEGTLNAAIKRMGYEGTIHGFRKIGSTSMNEKKFLADAIERQLSHVSKDKVRNVYNKAEYLEDRECIMNWWSTYLLDVRARRIQPIQYEIVAAA